MGTLSFGLLTVQNPKLSVYTAKEGISMTNHVDRVESTDDAWEEGRLGLDASNVRVVTIPEDEINESVSLKSISIRLEADLIETFKAIATIHGLGYQPLMRQALHRFADCEMKRIVREQAKEVQDKEEDRDSSEHRKAA